jgi:lysophospholipase L1-like esterase
MMRSVPAVAVLAAALLTPAILAAGDQFEFRDGDKVVLLGGALIEQEQLYGDWELLLTVAYPDRSVRFRNLGWSGDTVWGESRGMFEPHEGYQRMIEHVTQENPNVIVVAYGNNEAFGGEERLEAFAAQLQKLVDDLSADGRRFVFLSPLLMEAEQLPMPPAQAGEHARRYNRSVVQYSDVIRRIAGQQQQPYIDLQKPQLEAAEADQPPLTDNGLRLTADGYRQTARWLASRLQPAGNVDHLDAIVGLDFDAREVARLREAIQQKNQLYFHRWRPQNFTYLFGFRKHEQGNNAVEIPQFDPLVAEAEEEIAHLRQQIRPES